MHGTVGIQYAVHYATVPYGSVRDRTVRYGEAQYGRVQYGMVQYGTVQFGTVQFSTIWDDMESVRCAGERGGREGGRGAVQLSGRA